MRTALAAAVLAFLSVADASAQTPSPTPTAAPAASGQVARCAPSTRCLTAEMIPIGTAVKFTVTGYSGVAQKIHKIGGILTFVVSEDVVVNGRLIVDHATPMQYIATPGADVGGWTTPAFLPCSVSVTAGMVFTQDYQKLPLSFSDPKTSAPNLLEIPLVPAGANLCRLTNFPVTAYVSGPPSIAGLNPQPK